MKRLKWSMCLFLLGTGAPIWASSIPNKETDNLEMAKTIIIKKLDPKNGYEKEFQYPNECLNEFFVDNLDSVLESWYVQKFYSKELAQDITEVDVAKKTLSDSAYVERFNKLESLIDLSFNGTVKNFIDLYTVRRPKYLSTILGLSKFYFPMIEETLDKYQLPLELKYMVIVESALNPRAYSRMGASGLWQFMYWTGKTYGLKINSYIDERRDPMESTDAAARFLSEMYKIYGDWHLVIAAYNCGPGNVNKAIRRAGGSKNYWKIYPYLPKETRGYVPAFIAVAYAMNYAQEYGIEPVKPDFEIATDTIMVDKYLNFNQINHIIDVPVEELQELNPQYTKNIIPGAKNQQYVLRLPMEYISDYIDYEDKIMAYNRETYFPNNSIVIPAGNSTYTGHVSGTDRVYYTVKNGDNIGYISEWFHVKSSSLRSWNNIRRNFIKAGQKLVIYVPKGQGYYYRKLNSMSFAQKQHSKSQIPKTIVSRSSSGSKSTATVTKGKYQYYTIRKGDSLWSIAKKFSGVSIAELKQLNNLGSHSVLKPGQQIKLRPSA